MKTCGKCGVEKPLDDFQKRSAAKDGRQCWCRECQNAHMRTLYHSDEVHRARHIERAAKRMKLDALKKQRAAGSKARRAVKAGLLPSPADKMCSRCGAVPAEVMHHDDYDYPLEVTYFCRLCHGWWHSNVVGYLGKEPLP